MDFDAELRKLAEKHNLHYQFQKFENCFNGNWLVYTYSLYNESGCFTISYMPQRFEVDCYYAERFSTDRQELCNKAVDIFETEKDIWNRRETFWIFKNPFYYWSTKNIIKTLIEVINVSIEKNNGIYGIEIER